MEPFRVMVDDAREGFGMDIVCRNYNAGGCVVRLMGKRGIDELYLDFDLGPGKSGGDLLKDFLSNEMLKDTVEIFLVTDNPVGREAMKNTLTDFGYVKKGGAYVKEQKEEPNVCSV